MKFFRFRRKAAKSGGEGLTLSHKEWTTASEIPPTADASHFRFVALQPIFDLEQTVFGYEALSRSGWSNAFDGDEDQATQTMIDDWMLHGLHELTADAKAFVNCTRRSLLNGLLQLLPNSTVLELNNTFIADREVVDSCRGLKSFGYQIALDGFRLSLGSEGLIELADYIKIDFSTTGRRHRRQIFNTISGKQVQLVAEKVETREHFTTAVEEGFKLFQGYYLEPPVVLCKRRRTDHRVVPFASMIF